MLLVPFRKSSAGKEANRDRKPARWKRMCLLKSQKQRGWGWVCEEDRRLLRDHSEGESSQTSQHCRRRRCKERNIFKYPKYPGSWPETAKNLISFCGVFINWLYLQIYSTAGRKKVQDKNGGKIRILDRREGGTVWPKPPTIETNEHSEQMYTVLCTSLKRYANKARRQDKTFLKVFQTSCVLCFV